MSTASEYVNLALKRFLSRDRLDEHFFQYLYDDVKTLWTKIFPEPGFFTYPVTITPGANVFTLTPDPLNGTDEDGHDLILEGAARTTNIPFEDDGVSDYWIALHYIDLPSGMYANPRTGINEFDKYEEEIGRVGVPNSVTDNLDGTITFNVNNVTWVGSDYTGRSVWVWLRNPQTSDWSVALEHCVVAYAAPSNTITTVDHFGQSTISTDPNDYYIALDGPCVWPVVHGLGNPFSTDYLIIGFIDSGAGTATDASLQIDLSGGGGHTLQRAYDGMAGGGSGRNITVADQAVQLIQENNTPLECDIFQAALRLTKDLDKTQIGVVPIAEYESGVDTKTKLVSHGAYIHRVNLVDQTVNDYLRGTELVELQLVAGDEVEFVRVGIDLTFPACGASLDCFPMVVVEISGSALGNDGVFRVQAAGVAATTLSVENMDDSAVAFVQEIGNPSLQAEVYILQTMVGFPNAGVVICGPGGFYQDAGLPFASLMVTADDNFTGNLAYFECKGETVEIEYSGSVLATNAFNSSVAGGNNAFVAANGDLTLTNGDTFVGAGDYRYNPEKTFYVNLAPSEAEGNYDTIVKEPDWSLRYVNLAGHYYQGLISRKESVVAVVAIHLPDNVSVTYIQNLIEADGPPIANWMKIDFAYSQHNWAGPAEDEVHVLGTISATATGAVTLRTIDLHLAPVVIDNSTKNYFLVLTAGDKVGSLDRWIASRITYVVDEIRSIG